MRYFVILGVLLIVVPLLLRATSPEPFSDPSSYEALRSAKLGPYDSLQGHVHQSTVADLLYRAMPAQVVLIVCATITLVFLSLLIPKESFLFFAVTTPALIFTFTNVSEVAIGVASTSAAAYLFTKKHYWSLFCIPFCFTLSFPLGIFSGIALITVALVHKSPFIALVSSFVSLLSGIGSVVLFPSRSLGLAVPTLADLLGIVGSASGVTIFLVLLAVIGFLLVWRESKNNAYLLSLLLIPCTLFFDHGTLPLAIILAFYASAAWDSLANRSWHFGELQSITLILVVCGVLFTTIITEQERISLDQDRVDTTRFIRAAYPEGTPLYAEPSIGPLLAYYGYPVNEDSIRIRPGFTRSTLRDHGYYLVVAKKNPELYGSLRVVYAERQNGYVVYAVDE